MREDEAIWHSASAAVTTVTTADGIILIHYKHTTFNLPTRLADYHWALFTAITPIAPWARGINIILIVLVISRPWSVYLDVAAEIGLLSVITWMGIEKQDGSGRFNPSNAEAIFVQSTRAQRFLLTI